MKIVKLTSGKFLWSHQLPEEFLSNAGLLQFWQIFLEPELQSSGFLCVFASLSADKKHPELKTQVSRLAHAVCNWKNDVSLASVYG